MRAAAKFTRKYVMGEMRKIRADSALLHFHEDQRGNGVDVRQYIQRVQREREIETSRKSPRIGKVAEALLPTTTHVSGYPTDDEAVRCP